MIRAKNAAKLQRQVVRIAPPEPVEIDGIDAMPEALAAIQREAPHMTFGELTIQVGSGLPGPSPETTLSAVEVTPADSTPRQKVRTVLAGADRGISGLALRIECGIPKALYGERRGATGPSPYVKIRPFNRATTLTYATANGTTKRPAGQVEMQDSCLTQHYGLHLTAHYRNPA